MFEEEIQSLIELVARRTISGSPSIALRDILAAEIPHPVKTFFRADVETLLASEQRRERSATRFFYDHPEVQGLQLQMNTILVTHYAYDREEFLARVDDTIHMLVNYLVRPEWTLTSVLFQQDETISSQSLGRLFRYFGPYEYYREVVSRYVDDKQVTAFTRGEFASLLRKVDASFVRRKTGDELSRVLAPLFDFLDFPYRTATNALPIKSFIRFFEDKGLPQVVVRLEEERGRGTATLPRSALGTILEDVRRSHGAFETILTESAAAPARADAPSPAAADLLRAIGEKDRKRFVIRIFKQNEEAFTEAVQSMAALPSWQDASRYIDEIYTRNEIDPFSYDAERFSGIVFQQYHRTT